MLVNACAGRMVGDYANPPILPWATDFSAEIELGSDQRKFASSSPWRDLSKSKFRLKKGEEQLDITYSHASHHIPEGICELTYTVYRARSLPLDHLREVVREDFVAAHYPGSIQKMYEWTPDEATIEFYDGNIQPCIFCSMHEDMDDLALPPWCNDPDSFISYHRRLLESEHVSRQRESIESI